MKIIFYNFFYMKKYLYIILGITYFILFYILKEWFFGEEIVLFLNKFISLEKFYHISYIFAVIFIINWVIEWVFNKILKIEKNKIFKRHILQIFKKILKIFIWIFWFITIISNLWYNVWALLAWAGIWWIALALASQKTVANMFWAINILINSPFKIWDKIKIWLFTWEVEDIWITYLKLKSDDWHKIMIPNEIITTSAIENFSNTK